MLRVKKYSNRNVQNTQARIHNKDSGNNYQEIEDYSNRHHSTLAKKRTK